MPFRPYNRDQDWLIPPSWGDYIPLNDPARFTAAFVDSLNVEAWKKMGIDIRGNPLGAGAYDPRALLNVWILGFMTGVRTSRKLETACRKHVDFMWLAGNQTPDHNTLWRFYDANRAGMRALLKHTVMVAVESGYVDVALQAVDGTKVSGNASTSRTYGAERVRQLLEQADAAIANLEARNATGGDPTPASGPKEIASMEALRKRLSEAAARLEEKYGPNYANLTDPDAGLLKTAHGSFVAGYNAQLMVSPMSYDDGSVMIITAADVTSSGDDHPQLIPMIEAAAANTGTSHAVTLADAGYHSGANLFDCASSGRVALMPDTHGRKRGSPYHKSNFAYDPESDSYLCPQQQRLAFLDTFMHPKGYRIRRYRADGALCRACPAFGDCTTSEKGRRVSVSEYEPELRRHTELMSTEAAKETYKRRQGLVEPAFGLLKDLHGARRFLLRGLENVLSEWSLLATAFNLKSLHRVWSASLPLNSPGGASPRLRSGFSAPLTRKNPVAATLRGLRRLRPLRLAVRPRLTARNFHPVCG